MMIDVEFSIYKLTANNNGWECDNPLIEKMFNDTVGINKIKLYTPVKAISIVQLAQKMYGVKVINTRAEKGDISEEGTIY